MNISIVSGQIAKVHVKLETEEHFELYGGTDRASFDIAEERLNEFVVTVREETVAGKPLSRYSVYVRQPSSGREWVVLSGKLLVSPRTADVSADKLAPVEYQVTIPVVDNVVDLTGMAIVTGIIGPRGWSAYEIAVQEGFEGSEAEWLEHMRQQTATLAVEQVTPLMERAEAAAGYAESEAAAAKTAREAATAYAASARESKLAAAAHKTAAADEVIKAEQEAQKAAEHADAAAKSALNALDNQQGAEQAAREAAQAQVAATAAKNDADAAKLDAETSENNAKASADAAAADKTAAQKALKDALAAQSTAEEQAAIATKAAEDSQAPESIAAQSARPATMLLVKDELLSILGDASLFDLDTDGQKIIVHTDRLDDEQLAVVTDMLERFVPQFIEVVQYNHNMEISWRDINKYAACTNIADMLAVNPDYKNDLTSDGEWVYPLPKLESADRAFSEAGRLKRMVITLPSIKEGYRFLEYCVMDYAEISAPNDKGTKANVFIAYYGKALKYRCDKRTAIDYAIGACSNLEKAEIYAPEAESAGNLTATGGSKIRDFSWFVPKLKDAQYALYNAVLSKESAIAALNALPSWADGKEHLFTLGIHIDHQNDEEVLAAIAAAEERGWTLTVQWNGTPTSTASTFGFGQLIYAKVGEIERPDGTTEKYLDWGHYVTDETGYETFRSLASAYEYFGLPMPEQNDETLTNQ